MAVDWQMSYLSSGKDKMQALIVILIGLSIILAGCGKRDVISGFPAIDKKEAVKWRPGAGTVIALVSVALLFVFAYIGSNYKQQSITMSSFIIYQYP
jgi:hypothetical protein